MTHGKLIFLFSLCLALAIPALTQPTVTVVATFPRGATRGEPAPLIEGAGGNFYGVTRHVPLPNQTGTIFLTTSQGGLKTLFNFGVASNEVPNATLVEGRGGYLYGATYPGGAYGRGSIFKISRTGAIQTLHSFCQQTSCPDGLTVNYGLIRGLDGWVYGTTANGGAARKGVVLRIGPHGTYEVVHSFVHPKYIVFPRGGLVQASDGNLYGLAAGGAYGRGSIFMVRPRGHVKLFYSFGASNTEGYAPVGALTQGADGALYGITTGGGANGWGTPFKISLQGAYQAIYDFPNFYHTNFPGLIPASDGNLWEILTSASGEDFAYAFTTSGSIVQTINLSLQGIGATSTLMQGSDGRLYGGGLAAVGGHYVIYAIDAGLPPPPPSIVGFLPVHGPVGTKVVVGGGAHFVGTTGVTFNGVSATFVVNADGVISATVPTGASTGPIQVNNLGGSAATQTDFNVL